MVRRQKGAGGTSSKIAPEPTPALSARPTSPSGIELRERALSAVAALPPVACPASGRREASGRRVAWEAPPEIQEELDDFKRNIAKLPGHISEKIAEGVDSKTYALFRFMINKEIPEAQLPLKDADIQFIQMLPELLAPQKKHERDAVYTRVKRFATKHGLDPKNQLNAARALLNRRNDRRDLIQRLEATRYEDLNEEDQDLFETIEEYIEYDSQTTPKSLPWIVKILGNPELAVRMTAAIQEELQDLYLNTSMKYLDDRYFLRIDIRPFVKFAYQVHKMMEVVKSKKNQDKFQDYIALLEDIQRGIDERLNRAWGLLDNYFKAPWSHPNPRARTNYINEKILASFSIYMALRPETKKTFETFIKTYFLHSPTTMPTTYRDIIHIYNETYSVSMREFAFKILEQMVLNAETVLPVVKERLSVGRMYVATVEPFKEFYDEYYGTRYRPDDVKYYVRNYIEVLQLLKASLRLDAKETNEEEKARKKAFLDEKIAWFNKHYRRFLR
jgi:hypothetical protein